MLNSSKLSLLPILPRGEGNLVPTKDGWVKRSGVKLRSPPAETEGWKPPCCIFPHQQAQAYREFWEGTVPQLTMDTLHTSKRPSRAWELPGEPGRDQFLSLPSSQRGLWGTPAPHTSCPSERVPVPCDTRRKATPKLPRHLESYHQNRMTKELINLCHVVRLWNAVGTHFRISLLQKKANGALLLSAPKSGHRKQTEIVQDFRYFWKFGLLMRVSQKSS